MQDRFKFRVVYYNDVEKKYFIFEPDLISADGTARAYAYGESGADEYYDTGTLNQSTGLKDKSGKLIYEGDIVNVYVSSKKLYRYQVKFEIGSFMLVSNDEMFDFPNKWNDNVYPLSQLYFEYENEDYYINQLEIIGNIYENHDLLEVGNDNK